MYDLQLPTGPRSEDFVASRNIRTASRSACGPTIFCRHRLEAHDVQRLLGYQLLQLAVLLFQVPQPLRIADLQTDVLRLPAIERLLADPMLAAYLRRIKPCFGLLQNSDNLLFCLPALLHPFSSSATSCWLPLSENSHHLWTNRRGAAQSTHHRNYPLTLPCVQCPLPARPRLLAKCGFPPRLSISAICCRSYLPRLTCTRWYFCMHPASACFQSGPSTSAGTLFTRPKQK